MAEVVVVVEVALAVAEELCLVMLQAVERCRLEALPRIVWKNLKKLQEFGMLSLKVVTCSVTKNGN